MARIPVRRLIVYGSGLAVAGACYVLRKPGPEIAASAPVPVGPALEIVSHFGSDEALHAALNDAYRLAPDRRFLLAFSEVHRILGDAGSPPAVAKAVPDAFEIHDGPAVRGPLPELPDLGDVLPLLEAAARETLSKHPLALTSGRPTPQVLGVAHQIDVSWTGGTLESLAALEKLWAAGDRQEALFRQLVRCLARLSFQLTDDTRQGDLICARALAAVAIAHALGVDVAEDEALLASSLGYGRAARAGASGLPITSPVRAYLEERDDDLRAMARTGTSSAMSRYLLLRRLTARIDAKGYDALVKGLAPPERSSPLVLAAATEISRFGTRARAGAALSASLLESARKEAGLPATATTAIVPEFERALVAAPPLRGTFLDEEYRQALHRSFFYTGVLALVWFNLDDLGSPKSAAALRGQLGTLSSGPGADFLAWYDAVLAAESRKADTQRLAEIAATLPVRGGLQDRLHREIRKSASWGSPILRPATRTLAAGLDTRLGDRQVMAAAAREALGAISLAERLDRSVARDSDSPWMNMRVARLDRNVDALLDAARDVRIAGFLRVEALEALVEIPAADRGRVSDATIRETYAAVVAGDPDRWSVRESFIRWLDKQGEYPLAEKVAAEWVAKHGKARDLGLTPVHATTRLARIQQERGKLAEAWKTVQPALPSGAAGPMLRAARILEARGKHTEALEMANAVEARYGTTGTIARAELQWRHGDHAGAAGALSKPSRPLSKSEWHFEIADTFSEVFSGRPAEALKAFEALRAAGIPMEVQVDFGTGIDDGAISFAILDQIRPPGGWGMSILSKAWAAKADAEGEEAANAWLRGRIDLKTAPSLVYFLYDVGAWSVLWDIEPPSTPGDIADAVWEMRAATALRSHDESRVADVRKHYQATARGGRYDTLGRYLVGEATHEEVVALAGNTGETAEVAFVIAVQRQCAKRMEAANDWYRAAVETGAIQSLEYRSSHDELQHWRSRSASLARLGEMPPR